MLNNFCAVARCGMFLCFALSASGDVLIRDVTIINVVNGRATAHKDILVRGDRIVAITQARRETVPPNTRLIDGHGKFVMPGLWDMHVHLHPATPLPEVTSERFSRSYSAAEYVAHGVTGVRSLFDSIDVIKTFRQDTAAGTLVGPRIGAAGLIVDGPKQTRPGFLNVANAEQAEAAVYKVRQAGYDFVKPYSSLSRDSYFALVKAAKKAGLPVAGHAPQELSITEIADAGQKSIEHLQELLVASSRHDQNEPTVKVQSVIEREIAASGAYDPSVAATLFRKLASKGTWVTPTLAVHRTIARYPDPLITADPRLRHLPPGLLRAWEQRRRPTGAIDPLGRQHVFERYKDIVRGLHKAGVKMLVGSDVPNPYVYPGSSLHDELALLVDCGLTPAEVLRMSTLKAAEYLGLGEILGTVTKGKLADLVLLDANPLVDITNTRSIAAVIINGRMHSKRELDEILQRNRNSLGLTN